jgi:hypothetical protein
VDWIDRLNVEDVLRVFASASVEVSIVLKGTRQILTRAVETAPKIIYASRVAGRADRADRYYTDRQYLNAWAGTDARFFRPTYLDIDQRASFFQYVYSSATAMVNDIINRGSKYPGTYREGNGDLPEGSSTYKMHLPAGIPAAAF